MAKGKGSIKGWITKDGVHIPIYGEYTVRGGVEPEAKGSKFKGKKKPDKYTNPRTGKRDHVQGKTQADLNKALKEQGLELDGAYQRAENEEKVYMYDKDGNVYSGTFNKYSDGGREIVNIERDKLNGESNVRNLDPDRDEHIRNGESKGAKREEAIKKQENERFKTAKELKAEGKWDTSEKDKYADRDWNKDVDDSKRYGYSEQTEEGKKPVTKAEEKQTRQSFRDKKAQEQGFASAEDMESYNEETGVNKETWKDTDNTIEVNGRKINVKPGETNSQAIYRNAMEEQGKPIDKDFYEEQVGEGVRTIEVNGRQIRVRPGENNSQAIYRTAMEEQGKEVDREIYDSQRVDYNPDKKSTPESYAQSKGKSIRDIAQEVNNNDAARATANQLMKNGRTYEEAAALAHSDMERGTLKGQGSSTPKVSKTDAYNDKVFADFKKNGKDYQRVPMEGYAGTANDFRAAAKRAGVEIEYDKGDDTFYLRKSKQTSSTSTSTPERKKYKVDGNAIKGFKSAKEMTGRSDLTLHEIGNDNISTHYSFRDKDGNEIGQFHESHTNKKANYMTLNTSATGDRSKPISKQDSLSAGMNERSRIRGELHAKDKAMAAAMPTTVSGLRSAYADATGQMKSKIAAELRRKGYSLIGGKWVKGK